MDRRHGQNPRRHFLLDVGELIRLRTGGRAFRTNCATTKGFCHDVNETLFGPAPPSRVAFGAATPPEVGPSWYTNPLFEPFTGYPHGAPTLGPLTMGDNSIIYGLDTATLRNAPAMEPVLACTDTGLANCYFDLMSYCRDQGSLDEDAWPSRVTYASLLSSNNTYFGSSPVRLPQARVHGLTPPPPGHGRS